ncbi:MAG TPA: pyridoxamine 5'-phosphate oxidase family protein [Candidatus Thermoplasmatota archaeon]|nr:pyridoxamine 5'-phosphate oxidase family protein [Candidatus Thermoplasmatota archaeon]
MASMFHEGSRALQDRFDTRRLADRIEEVLVRDAFTEDDREFIGAQRMLFLATADHEGRPSVSYKGGDPGFARVLDERTLAFPSYDGNGMFVSLGNLARNPHVGILFIDFESPGRLRVNGVASARDDDPLLAEWPGAQLVVRVTPREVFPNCPRYVHRMEVAEPSPFVPREGCRTPVPGWKRAPWARDVLARDDPARAR